MAAAQIGLSNLPGNSSSRRRMRCRNCVRQNINEAARTLMATTVGVIEHLVSCGHFFGRIVPKKAKLLAAIMIPQAVIIPCCVGVGPWLPATGAAMQQMIERQASERTIAATRIV